MAFSNKRGRPAIPRDDAPDFGTPELRMKRLANITSEPLDLCLTRHIISPDQHWCGLHLRWLYTVRYGAPVLTTHYTDRLLSPGGTPQNDLWRSLREQEYLEAATALHAAGRYDAVMRLCVFNELPAFLSPKLLQKAWDNPAFEAAFSRQQCQLISGLQVLCRLWKSSPRANN
jgi:hypothetical protein